MRDRYLYKIEIKLNDKDESNTLFSGPIQYNGGGSYTDQLEITNNRISISGTRASKIDLNGVFNNYQSALYGQFSKAVFFYTCSTHTIPDISSITIATLFREKEIDRLSIGSGDFKSHATLTSRFLSVFKTDRLKIILNECEKGTGLLKAVSHLTRSKTKADVYDRFDSLWKSFNALYRVIAQKRSDHDCQKETRAFILKHPRASETSATIVEKLTGAELRNKVRWRQLILNDYDSERKAEAYKDFILRYTDTRLMHVFNETLPYRIDFLSKRGYSGAVEAHIDQHMKADTLDNQQLVAALCIKYAYFVRNKSAHGERLDRIIGLSDKELTEVGWLSDLLESLIIDLINSNDLY